jgi:Sec-independent protein translocase protein TatA
MVGGRLGDRPDKPRDGAELTADLREAYDRGRRDERARRRRHPIGMTLTFIVALVGLVVLVLAAVNGSFGRAGESIDRGLTIARPAASQAAATASEQLRDASDAAKAKAKAKASDAAG